MYKIFFKDRVIFLTSDIETHLTSDFGAILKYANQGELKQFVERFEQDPTVKSAFVYYHNVYELLQHFRTCFVNLPAAGGLVWNGNRTAFLVMKRRGFFDLPKGKVEKEEGFEQAAIREVEEECGISGVQLSKFLVSTYHTYRIDDKPIFKETRWYDMVYLGGEMPIPQTSESIEDVFWMKPEEIPNIENSTYLSILEVLKSGVTYK